MQKNKIADDMWQQYQEVLHQWRLAGIPADEESDEESEEESEGNDSDLMFNIKEKTFYSTYNINFTYNKQKNKLLWLMITF